MNKTVNIIGAGPTGLFCSYLLIKSGLRVNLYDQMGGVGKKFLVAGNGGLNLTHSEDLDQFLQKYGINSDRFSSYIKEFSPDNLRNWCENLGVETFIGSSGRVFPKKLKAAELLSLWMKKLKESPLFTLNLKHRLVNINKEGVALFDHGGSEVETSGDITILCLGGGSWKKTGSDGKWVKSLEALNLEVEEFKSMNCGFTVKWSDHFLKDFDDTYLKNVKVLFNDISISGEVMLTKYGIEGGAIYAHSRDIQKSLSLDKQAIIHLDLKPSLDEEAVFNKINRSMNKNSMSNHLRKTLNLSKASLRLIREIVPKESLQDMRSLAKSIKSLPIGLVEARPLDEAISTGGGVMFKCLDESLMIKGSQSIYLAGEMIDWEAPTGGYLLQGCFSMANHVVKSIIAKHS